MHSVLKNILARRNKAVPVKDGRKIVLVMFGGTMTGIRGGAAGIALHELGLTHAFDEIYSVSSGFGNASCFLSEQIRHSTHAYYDYLPKGDFINWLRPWKLVDIDLLVQTMKVRGFDAKRLLACKTKLYACLYNLDKRCADYLEVHDFGPRQYYKLLKAATCIPYLSPGFVKIGQYRYEDLPWTHRHYNDFLNHVVTTSRASDILIIYNYHGQSKLQGSLPDHVYEIVPKKEWNLKRLEIDPKILIKECRQMGTFVKDQFGQPGEILLHNE